MKINDTTLKLTTIRFVSFPGHIGLGRPGFKTVWKRNHGSTVWTKDGTGATKSSAQMATALRWFATHDSSFVLNLTDAANGIACVAAREGYLAPPRTKAPGFAYRCAGCGDLVARKHRAMAGEPVWCGGRRCAKTFTIRLGDPGDTERDIDRLHARLLPVIEVRRVV